MALRSDELVVLLGSVEAMEAVITQRRIDILEANSLPKDSWELLLDELRAEHVPSATPTGKRMAVVGNPKGGMDAFIFRTASMSDEEVIRILGKYGISARVSSESASSA
jgi:hypothetical protein